MEARTYAKMNQLKSDQINKDIDVFLAAGGKIQVLPTTHKDRIISPDVPSIFDIQKQRTAQLRAKKQVVNDTTLDDEDSDSAEVSPSRETPTEQLDIEAG